MPARKRKSESPSATRPYMPGYGVPKGRKGILPWSWAEQRLKKSHNFWITTVRPDGSPHTMVIWGLWIDGAFYFSTGQESRKAKNLACNPKCIVCTENSSEAVVVEGEARRVHDSPDLKFFARYEKKYDWDMSEMQKEPIYAVRPRVAFGLYEKKFQNAATRWNF
ncbi:MAG: pyridoxamine 5'-phosphate oxidase [Acidobacteria bacterium]|nr:MAG: pyridoxamine 5'-phosphate oxidase [Acidobacteriota bacterium]